MEGGYHGHDGDRRWWQNLLDAIPDFTIEVIEVRERGDVTLTKMHTSGHGANSDSPLEETNWVAVQWRDKKVLWWGIFATEAEALEAVGLSESEPLWSERVCYAPGRIRTCDFCLRRTLTRSA